MGKPSYAQAAAASSNEKLGQIEEGRKLVGTILILMPTKKNDVNNRILRYRILAKLGFRLALQYRLRL
jgi:hypothetical protein